MGKWLWFGGILDSVINKEKETNKHLQTTTSSQLERELQSQDQYLDEQNTEMWVSKDAMSKYPTMRWRPTKLMIIATLVWIAYWAKKAVDYWLNSIDQWSQQEEVVNDTQENLQNTFVLDSVTIIDYYKETLSADEIEEFEQFSKEEQRKLANEK